MLAPLPAYTVTNFPADPLIEQLRSHLIERTRGLREHYFKVRGLWRLDYRYRPNELERDLAYSIVLVQAQHQGAAYVTYQSPQIDDALLDADARYITSDQSAVTIAALDAAYANLPRSPARIITYSGDAETKAVRRSQIICDEVAQIAAESGAERVLNIGVMGNFVPWIAKAGLQYLGADYDEGLIQNGIGGHVVLDGRWTLQAIKNADIVLCTGMTLTTGTLSGIVARCKKSGAKLVLFAATGSYFGETYCDKFGVDCVISEPQPQYMFSGTSVIEVHRHDR